MSKIYSNNDPIEINFPEDKFQKYLSLLKIEEKDLNSVSIELIFALSFRDFKLGKNSLDELSEISGYLLSLIDSNLRISRFGTALEFASELNFYIRNVEDSKDSSIANFMTAVEDYFKKIRPNLLDQIKDLA